MMMCQICGTVFDYPIIKKSKEHGVVYIDRMCPVCNEEYIDEANSCPGCDGFKFRDEILCKKCRGDLLKRFTAFADELTAEQEAQLDEWLDGDTIENRGKWS